MVVTLANASYRLLLVQFPYLPKVVHVDPDKCKWHLVKLSVWVQRIIQLSEPQRSQNQLENTVKSNVTS